jgi:hypothetical protein
MRLLTSALLTAWAVGALAAGPSQTCESAKNKDAGKYSYCRQRAEARYAITGNAQAHQRALGACAASIAGRWRLIETKANGACPSNGDLPAIEAAIDDHTTAIATALAGGALPDCPSNLATCEGVLGTCEAVLGTCNAALGSCLAGRQSHYLSTGQTMCWKDAGKPMPCAGTGQDGEFQKGLTHSYTENGDGTISDNRTGLVWEKLSADGSIHDEDNLYSWAGAFVRIAELNQRAFAGHTDWRLPNLNELLTLVNFAARKPAAWPEFNTGCVPACTIATCSCTNWDTEYWSSTLEPFPTYSFPSWSIKPRVSNALDGSVFAGLDYTDAIGVRAVRGGF